MFVFFIFPFCMRVCVCVYCFGQISYSSLCMCVYVYVYISIYKDYHNGDDDNNMKVIKILTMKLNSLHVMKTCFMN